MGNGMILGFFFMIRLIRLIIGIIFFNFFIIIFFFMACVGLTKSLIKNISSTTSDNMNMAMEVRLPCANTIVNVLVGEWKRVKRTVVHSRTKNSRREQHTHWQRGQTVWGQVSYVEWEYHRLRMKKHIYNTTLDCTDELDRQLRGQERECVLSVERSAPVYIPVPSPFVFYTIGTKCIDKQTKAVLPMIFGVKINHKISLSLSLTLP